MRVIVAHHWVLIPYQVICLIKKENIDLVYCFGKWGAINFDIWQLRISLPSEEKTWLVKAPISHQANLLFLRHHSLLYIYLFLLSALSPLLSACMFPAGSSPLSARLICLHVAQWQVALYGVAQLVCVAHVHYHRRSHHPSSLTSQCPSSSLSIPEPEPQQCTSGTVLRTVFSAKEVFLALLFSLWSALMDPAMQSDQGPAQTPGHRAWICICICKDTFLILKKYFLDCWEIFV